MRRDMWGNPDGNQYTLRNMVKGTDWFRIIYHLIYAKDPFAFSHIWATSVVNILWTKTQGVNGVSSNQQGSEQAAIFCTSCAKSSCTHHIFSRGFPYQVYRILLTRMVQIRSDPIATRRIIDDRTRKQRRLQSLSIPIQPNNNWLIRTRLTVNHWLLQCTLGQARWPHMINQTTLMCIWWLCVLVRASIWFPEMGSHEKWRLAYQASPQVEAPKNLVGTEIKSRQLLVVVEIA